MSSNIASDRYRLTSAVALVCVAIPLATAGALVAGEPDFDTAQRAAMAANPPGVTLALAADESVRRFRLGDPLPLKLTFTFADSKRYDFDDHNRAPNLTRMVDSFYAAPAAGVRRLESSIARQGGGFLGSASPLAPGQTTRARLAPLDEWLQFERPGKYRVYCTSRRVWKAGTGPPFPKPLNVTSAVLEIEILPLPADELAEKLRQADQDFGPGVPKERRLGAVAWLRRLDNEEAARLLAGVYQGSSYGDDAFDDAVARALDESRHRRIVVAELERRLRERDFGPQFTLLYKLAELDCESAKPSGTALNVLDAAQRERYAKITSDARYHRQQILLAAYAEFMWRELPNKSPTARAATAFALYGLRSSGQLRRDAIFAWTMSQLRAIIQSDFLLLPASDQHRLLGLYWRRLGGAALAPALAEIIQRARQQPAKPHYADHSPKMLDTVFERLLAADPIEARRLVIAEIRRGKPRVITKTLLLLPDRPIAELDQLLIQRLEKLPQDDFDAFRRTAALANRYGSVAMLPCVQRIVRRLANEQIVGEYPPLLCYWLKYAPKTGIEMVEKALQQRENNQHQDLLSEMASFRLAPELLPICIRRLNDPDEMVMESAATVLGSFGTAEARQALKARLRRWHDDLIAADPQAKDNILAEGYNGPHRVFDSFVLLDLQRSPITVVTPQELRELRPLCMTKQALQEIDYALGAWADPIPISFQQGGESEFEHPGWPSAGGGSGPGLVDDTWYVADQYFARSKTELKALLARFPHGSTFALPTYFSTDAGEFQKFFDELSAYVEKLGMKLVKVDR